MNREDFLQKQYEFSITAGMNQRYHQRYAWWWSLLDGATKAITAIAAVVSALLSVVTLNAAAASGWTTASVVVSVVAAFVAVALNVVPFGTWEQRHRDLFRQWTDLREDTDLLELDLAEGEPDVHHLGELRRITSKIHRIVGEEPSPNEKILKKCYDAEEESRKSDL